MPMNAPYPGETEQAFRARMQAMGMGGVGGMNLGGVPGAPPPAPAGPTPADQMPPPAAMGDPLNPSSWMQRPAAPQPGAIDPNVAAAMLDTYGMQSELSELDRQLAEANALRNTALPEGRQAGRTFVAANPLEFLGTGLKQYRGMKEAKRIEPERKRLRGEIGKNVGRYGKLALEDED